MKSMTFALLCGIGIAGLTLLVPYEHCMDGDARGFPFAVSSPACNAPWGPALALDPADKTSQVVDFGSFAGNVFVWTLCSGVVQRILRRVQTRKSAGIGAIS